MIMGMAVPWQCPSPPLPRSRRSSPSILASSELRSMLIDKRVWTWSMSNQFGLSVDMLHACNMQQRGGACQTQNLPWRRSCLQLQLFLGILMTTHQAKPSISSPRIFSMLIFASFDMIILHHVASFAEKSTDIRVRINSCISICRLSLPSPFPRATHAANGLSLGVVGAG